MDKITVDQSEFQAMREYSARQLRKEFDDAPSLVETFIPMEQAFKMGLNEEFEQMLSDAKDDCDTPSQKWILKTWFDNLTKDSDFSEPDPHDFNVPNDIEAAVPGLEFIVTEISQERVKVA